MSDLTEAPQTRQKRDAYRRLEAALTEFEAAVMALRDTDAIEDAEQGEYRYEQLYTAYTDAEYAAARMKRSDEDFRQEGI